MNESAGPATNGENENELPNSREAYEAFNVIWSKVARSVRAETENQRRMRVVRAYFDNELALEAERLEEEKRVRIAENALDAAKVAGSDEAKEEAASPSMLHAALRVLRMLSRREWEMAKAIVDLHKFEPDDLLDLVREVQESHCLACGMWLDDDDQHADCPAEEPEEAAPPAEAAPATRATVAAIVKQVEAALDLTRATVAVTPTLEAIVKQAEAALDDTPAKDAKEAESSPSIGEQGASGAKNESSPSIGEQGASEAEGKKE